MEEFIVGVEQHQLGLRADELVQEGIGGGNGVLFRVIRNAGPHLAHHRLTAGGDGQGGVFLLGDLINFRPLLHPGLQPGADDVASYQHPSPGAQPHAFRAEAG